MVHGHMLFLLDFNILFSAVVDGSIISANIMTNGYIRFANGLIIQWMEVLPQEINSNSIIYYPISFSLVFVINAFSVSYHETSYDLNMHFVIYYFKAVCFKLASPVQSSGPLAKIIIIGK